MKPVKQRRRVTQVTEPPAFVIECAPEIVKGMRGRAGALFGSKTESGVRVAASRPFPFRYRSGAFTGMQDAKLEDLLRSCERDEGLRATIPVGWYVKRDAAPLGAAEEALFARFFPEPWQITVVRTRREAACFFRGPDGALRSTSLPAPQRRRALGAVAALAAAALLFFTRPAPKPPAGGIGLRVSEEGGQLRIAWDQRSPDVAAALGAQLEIEDGGGVTRIRLDRSLLETGRVFYSRWSESPVVRMVLERAGRPPLEESARITGPPVLFARIDVPASGEADRVVVPDPVIEPDPVVEPDPAVERIRAEAKAEPVTRTFEPARRFHPPAPRARVSAALRPMPEAPALAVAPRTPAALRIEPPRPQPPQVRRPEPPPRRGQMIWTGRLERRGVLHIEGPRATAGHLSGALPGGPAEVVVLPGEMTATGLRLYTANPALANLVERPGPENGWNATEYVWDPVRAKEISVLEAPGRYNGWNQLVLRAENRDYSVLVLKWESRP